MSFPWSLILSVRIGKLDNGVLRVQMSHLIRLLLLIVENSQTLLQAQERRLRGGFHEENLRVGARRCRPGRRQALNVVNETLVFAFDAPQVIPDGAERVEHCQVA